jgi:methylated-DNA-[protein]-cysteine S-methyltransferase
VPPDLDSRVARAAARDDVLDVAWTMFDSPIAPLVLAATEAGLVLVSYDDPDAALALLARLVSPRVLEAPARLDPARRQLDEYFTGGRRQFDVTLDRRLSHGFRREVLDELVQVPFGQVVSYAELAKRAGRPRAVRAVGTTMATNPLPIIQPCHRVLRSGGALGNYGGGVDAKRWLLRHEGVSVD